MMGWILEIDLNMRVRKYMELPINMGKEQERSLN